MNTELALNTAQKINALHSEVCASVRMTIDKALQIGELLTQEKPHHHTKWVRWCQENLQFSYTTAYRYICLHQNRHHLPAGNISLQEAVQFFAVVKPTRKEQQFRADIHLIDEARPIEDVVDSESIQEVSHQIQAEEDKEQKAQTGATYRHAKEKVIRCWKLLSDGEDQQASRHLAKVLIDFLFKLYPDLQ